MRYGRCDSCGFGTDRLIGQDDGRQLCLPCDEYEGEPEYIAAREAYEARVAALPGHHMPAWEGLSEMERSRLVLAAAVAGRVP